VPRGQAHLAAAKDRSRRDTRPFLRAFGRPPDASTVSRIERDVLANGMAVWSIAHGAAAVVIVASIHARDRRRSLDRPGRRG